MLAHALTADAIPNKVKSLAIKDIKNEANSLKLWGLADTGWRTILLRHKAEVHEKWLGKFNTPKTEQVDGLYEEMLGLNSLSSHWAWKGMKADRAKTKLDDFITVRGNIAHRIRDAGPVAKNTGAAYLTHVRQIVDRCERAVANRLNAHGVAPW